MSGKLSPIFQLFHQQYNEGKSLFNDLGKQFKGKKAVDLESKLIFLEIYVDLLSRIHFNEEKLRFELFSPFKKIFKGLKKVKHLKVIEKQLAEQELKHNINFGSYTKALASEKKMLYTEVFDLIVGAPLKMWEKLYEDAHLYSLGLKPLMINTATTQIINEELEFFNLEDKNRLNYKGLKDIYEGLRIIIALENLRVESGFNAIFVEEVHKHMEDLQKSLLLWYENHLFMQHLTAFLADKENISKKYLDLLADLNTNKKAYTQSVALGCKSLFEKILE